MGSSLISGNSHKLGIPMAWEVPETREFPVSWETPKPWEIPGNSCMGNSHEGNSWERNPQEGGSRVFPYENSHKKYESSKTLC